MVRTIYNYSIPSMSSLPQFSASEWTHWSLDQIFLLWLDQVKWSDQHNTEGEEEPESNIPGIAARPAPEGETCPSIDESASLLNRVVSINNNKLVATLQNQLEN
jgi:hypothetical protein